MVISQRNGHVSTTENSPRVSCRSRIRIFHGHVEPCAHEDQVGVYVQLQSAVCRLIAVMYNFMGRTREGAGVNAMRRDLKDNCHKKCPENISWSVWEFLVNMLAHSACDNAVPEGKECATESGQKLFGYSSCKTDTLPALWTDRANATAN